MKMTFMKKVSNVYLLNETDKCVDERINEWRPE